MNEQFIGDYKVIDRIGQGGMGKVYLGVHKDVPNLRVILKILSDPRLADRFKQEADKLALLDGHPNICQIKHFFNHGDDIVIAMEYIEGRTLDDEVKEGRATISESVRIVADMLAILSYAHERGISHRDIKPSNVMIDKKGQVKIIDFGIAKGKTDPNLTMTGASLGTPAYMAPEQFVPTDDTDFSLADIYACGTTLYQLVTGKLPFVAENEFVMRDAKLNQTPASPREANPGISKDLEKVIMRSLDKDPLKRFSSAEEMRKAMIAAHRLDEERGSHPTIETQPRKKASGSGPVIPPRKKKTSYAKYGIGVAALVVVAVVVYLLTGGVAEKAQVPAAPDLLNPPEAAALENSTPIVLKWTPTIEGRGQYVIEYSLEESFGHIKSLVAVADSFVIPAGFEAGHYYWRVIPMTDEGVAGDTSVVQSFMVVAETTPQGRLVIRVSPSGDIYLGEQQLESGSRQASITVDTGEYEVRVTNSRSDEKEFREQVRVRAGDTVRRVFSFTMPRPKPEVKPGEVRIGSRPPGAKIYVDGTYQNMQTINTVFLNPGRHVISVRLEVGGVERELTDTLRVAADSLHRVIFDFEE